MLYKINAFIYIVRVQPILFKVDVSPIRPGGSILKKSTGMKQTCTFFAKCFAELIAPPLLWAKIENL